MRDCNIIDVEPFDHECEHFSGWNLLKAATIGWL